MQTNYGRYQPGHDDVSLKPALWCLGCAEDGNYQEDVRLIWVQPDGQSGEPSIAEWMALADGHETEHHANQRPDAAGRLAARVVRNDAQPMVGPICLGANEIDDLRTVLTEHRDMRRQVGAPTLADEHEAKRHAATAHEGAAFMDELASASRAFPLLRAIESAGGGFHA